MSQMGASLFQMGMSPFQMGNSHPKWANGDIPVPHGDVPIPDREILIPNGDIPVIPVPDGDVPIPDGEILISRNSPAGSGAANLFSELVSKWSCARCRALRGSQPFPNQGGAKNLSYRGCLAWDRDRDRNKREVERRAFVAEIPLDSFFSMAGVIRI